MILSVLLRKLLLFLPNPCNRKFLQSLHGAFLNHESLSPLPTSFSSRPLLPILGESWVYRHYWVRRHRLSRGDPYLSKPFISSLFWPTVSPCLLWALLTGLQYPSPSWMMTTSCRCCRKHRGVLQSETSGNLSSTVLQQ